MTVYNQAVDLTVNIVPAETFSLMYAKSSALSINIVPSETFAVTFLKAVSLTINIVPSKTFAVFYVKAVSLTIQIVPTVLKNFLKTFGLSIENHPSMLKLQSNTYTIEINITPIFQRAVTFAKTILNTIAITPEAIKVISVILRLTVQIVPTKLQQYLIGFVVENIINIEPVSTTRNFIRGFVRLINRTWNVILRRREPDE